jgi:hypothetical protein
MMRINNLNYDHLLNLSRYNARNHGPVENWPLKFFLLYS